MSLNTLFDEVDVELIAWKSWLKALGIDYNSLSTDRPDGSRYGSLKIDGHKADFDIWYASKDK